MYLSADGFNQDSGKRAIPSGRELGGHALSHDDVALVGPHASYFAPNPENMMPTVRMAISTSSHAEKFLM